MRLGCTKRMFLNETLSIKSVAQLAARLQQRLNQCHAVSSCPSRINHTRVSVPRTLNPQQPFNHPLPRRVTSSDLIQQRQEHIDLSCVQRHCGQVPDSLTCWRVNSDTASAAVWAGTADTRSMSTWRAWLPMKDPVLHWSDGKCVWCVCACVLRIFVFVSVCVCVWLIGTYWLRVRFA